MLESLNFLQHDSHTRRHSAVARDGADIHDAAQTTGNGATGTSGAAEETPGTEKEMLHLTVAGARTARHQHEWMTT